MTKKLSILLSISAIFIGALLLFSPAKAQYQNTSLNIYFFRGEGCPHCEDELVLLNQIIKDHPQVKIRDFEIFYNGDNAKLLTQVVKKLGIDYQGTPYTVIGDKVFSGYSESPTADEILDRVDYCLKRGCPDSVAEIVGRTDETPGDPTPPETKPVGWPTKIQTPFGGEIDTANVSLPVLTLIIGLLDGFNPCAMWTLVFLITLLINMGNRRRMWILGGTFIFISGAVYYIFMAAWLNMLLFVGMIIWMRLAIGLAAITFGGLNLKKYLEKKDDTCEVTQDEGRKKTFDRLREIVKHQSFWLALIGMIALAFMVNLVELICSAGFPAVYTQVLALSNLPKWQYYLYIFGYIFFYMLDDMIVFFLSMWALRVTGLTNKYTRVTNLVGGLLMVILGILLIFKPGWLMFG